MKDVDQILEEGIEPARLARSLQELSGSLRLREGRDESLARWAESWGAELIADISQRSVAVGRLLAVRIFLQQGLTSAMLMVRGLEAVAKSTSSKARIKAVIVEVMKRHARPMVLNSWLSEGAGLYDTAADIQDHAARRSVEDQESLEATEMRHVN